MDAGAPIASPVAGIAMGLVLEGKDYAVLTDIAGAEDPHYGDMDFKVAGTKTGITALQMDIKVPNVTHAVLTEALEQARKARLYILDKMNAVIDTPRTILSPLRATHFLVEDSDGQDPRADRARRQGHSWNRVDADGLQDRCRGRWQREDLLVRRRGRGIEVRFRW